MRTRGILSRSSANINRVILYLEMNSKSEYGSKGFSRSLKILCLLKLLSKYSILISILDKSVQRP